MKCKFCDKECKNDNSLRNHERLCKLNPNRQLTVFQTNNPVKRDGPWNKGLNKDIDDRIIKQCLTYKNNHILGLHTHYGHPHTKESKLKLREAALRNNLGGFHLRRGLIYNDIKLDSSYEVALAQSLDKNNIKWERPSRFKYYDLNNKLHYYTPDFYLPDYNIYLDPKNDFLINNINPKLGYSDKDKIKWVMEQNKIKVLILGSQHLNWASILKLLP